MKAKKTALLLIIILIISVCILLVTMFFLIKQEVKNNNIGVGENQKNNAGINILNEEDNEIGYDFDPEYGMDIFSDEELEGTEQSNIYENYEINSEGEEVLVPQYTEEDINNLQFEIKEIPEELSEYIKNKEDMFFQIKKYIYTNPQLVATQATATRYKFQNQDTTLTIYFDLNDNLTELIVSIDLEDNTITVEDVFKDK